MTCPFFLCEIVNLSAVLHESGRLQLLDSRCNKYLPTCVRVSLGVNGSIPRNLALAKTIAIVKLSDQRSELPGKELCYF